GAERNVEVITGANEGCRILGPVERVGEEHAAEEHDFGDEAHPHAERARLALLLHVFKMVLQRRMMRRVFVSCRYSFSHLLKRRHLACGSPASCRRFNPSAHADGTDIMSLPALASQTSQPLPYVP